MFVFLLPLFETASASWFYRSEPDVYNIREWKKTRDGKEIRRFDSRAYPFSAVGLFRDSDRTCTAFLVGPREVLTAAHCVINKETAGFKEHLTLSLKPFKKKSEELRLPLTPLFCGWTVGNKESFNHFNDWCLLRTQETVGYDNGWLGLKDSSNNQTAPNQKVDQKILEKLGPYLTSSTNVLKNLRALPDPWILTNPWSYSGLPPTNEKLLLEYEPTTQIFSIGFLFPNQINMIKNGAHQVYHPLSISYGCHLRAYTNWSRYLPKRLVHDCDSSEGGSGSPLIEIDNGWPHVVGVHVSARRNGLVQSGMDHVNRIYNLLLEVYNNSLENQVPNEKTMLLLSFSDIELSPPLNSEEILQTMIKHLNKMQLSYSSLGRFLFTKSEDEELEDGFGNWDHYNVAASADDFFHPVYEYLKRKYPNLY